LSEESTKSVMDVMMENYRNEFPLDDNYSTLFTDNTDDKEVDINDANEDNIEYV
jgi:hypothetical protein